MNQPAPGCWMLVLTPEGHLHEHVSGEADSEIGEAISTQIGCTVLDVVHLSSTIDLWVDDEGMMVEQPQINAFATWVIRQYGSTHHLLFGTVVFTGGVDAEGHTLSLSAEAKQELLTLIREAA